MYEAFIDLDELIVRCRDKSSKKFIQEAVSCYRAGAFRSCIVSTWNAVVFDFLHKLRELEILGDRQAAKLLEEFDDLRVSEKKFKELWQFEFNIPEIALTKFELISNIEKSDIARLFEDRSRCAHPSMTSLEEPFEATAELARYHLRSAVTHLLERPPVQGRAARERIFQDIKSEYFPIDPELARKYFQKSPLARARFILVKDIVIGLTKDLLTEDRLEDERLRQFSALNAISSMYSQETREILNIQLSDIILNRVKDEDWDKAIVYLGSITAWDSISEPCMLKAKAYVDKLDIFETHQNYSKESFQFETFKTSQNYSKRYSKKVIFILLKASHIDFLRASVANKFYIPIKELFSLVENCKDNIFRETIFIPILRELSPQATLDELILMRSETLLRSDEIIQVYTKEKINISPLTKLTSIISKPQDNLFINLIESEIKIKIPTTNLEDLLTAKSIYKSTNEQKTEILELFSNFINQQLKEEVKTLTLEKIVSLITTYEDEIIIDLIELDIKEKISTASLESLLAAKSTCEWIDESKFMILNKLLNNSINQQFENASFEVLFEQVSNWNEIADEITVPVLKKNIPAIIESFINSGSFKSGGENSKFLVKIAEYLSQTQWENILEAFFKNDQLYGSYSCCDEFELLFKKSIKLKNSMQPYWLAFRQKLDDDKYNNTSIKKLKILIDSHV